MVSAHIGTQFELDTLILTYDLYESKTRMKYDVGKRYNNIQPEQLTRPRNLKKLHSTVIVEVVLDAS